MCERFGRERRRNRKWFLEKNNGMGGWGANQPQQQELGEEGEETQLGVELREMTLNRFGKKKNQRVPEWKSLNAINADC